MSDPTDDTLAEAPIFDMKAMRDKFRPVIDTSKAARKARHKALTATAKASSRRATGRVAQFNFKCTPGMHQRAKDIAERLGIPLAEWMENVVEAALLAEEGGNA